MKISEYQISTEKRPRHLSHAIHVGSAGGNLYLFGAINNPEQPQSYLRLSLLLPHSIGEQDNYQPAESASVHLDKKQVFELIQDLNEQLARMDKKEEGGA